jgi:hypothetical protein
MSAGLRYTPTEFICTDIVLCWLPQIPANLFDVGFLGFIDDRGRGAVKYGGLVWNWVARSDDEWTFRYLLSHCG